MVSKWLIYQFSREEKNSATFIFRTHRDEEPRFSGKMIIWWKYVLVAYITFIWKGFVVTDYKSYAVIDEDSVNYFDITQRTNDTLLGINVLTLIYFI